MGEVQAKPVNRAPQVKGYSEAGASVTRRALKGFTAVSGSPNEDINYNNFRLRQRSRMLVMSSPVAASAINSNRTKVIGTGLTFKSSIDRNVLGMSKEAAAEWQRKAEAEFSVWADKARNCDALGLNPFSGLQQIALTSWLTGGDVFAVMKHVKRTKMQPYSLRIHLVEADRISTPDRLGSGISSIGYTDGENPETGNKIYDGVEVDSDGLVVAYHIRNTFPDAIVREPTKWTRVEAYGQRTGLPNVLHVMSADRCDQYRGVPYLANVIEALLQNRRFTESELTAAIIQSFYTAWIETEADTSDLPFNETGAGDLAGTPGGSPLENNVSNSVYEYELGPGTTVVLKPGEKIVFGNPNIPTSGFDTFTKVICREIGAALDIPYEVLLKEFNTSYSASRAALLEAWEGFKIRRQWIVSKLCNPVYEVWLSEAVASGRIKAPGFFDDPLLHTAWCGSKWIGPVQGSLDPLKEAKAAVLQVAHGFKTHEEVTRETSGGDWEENVEQLRLENELLAEAGAAPVSVSLNINDEEENGGNEQD